MNELVFQDGASQALLRELLASETETAAMLVATPCRTEAGHWRLLVTDVLNVPPDAYLRRTSASLAIAPEFTAHVLKKARISGSSVVFVHTHPFGGGVRASDVDRDGESVLLPTAFSRVPGVPHARLILGREGYDAALFEGGIDEHPLQVTDVGPVLIRPAPTPREFRTNSMFDRQVRAFGAAGQQRLQSFRVGIIGLGGTGSVVAQQLAYLGVRNLLLIDPENVEESNLNRLVLASKSDVGKSKVDVARGGIQQIRQDAEVEAVRD